MAHEHNYVTIQPTSTSNTEKCPNSIKDAGAGINCIVLSLPGFSVETQDIASVQYFEPLP
jgi:hypothetical protein